MLPETWPGLEEAPAAIKAWVLDGLALYLPSPLVLLADVLMTITPIICIFGGLFAALTLIERKGLGRFQNRFGPNRVGIFGILQPVADGIKMLIKEDIVPDRADKLLHFLAPVLIVVPALLAFSVIPFGQFMVPIELNAGLILFFALGGSAELAIFMAGWSSRNKYSLLGAMRSIAQMISYGIPLVLSSIPVVLVTGSLSPKEFADAQAHYLGGWFPAWHLFTPWGLAGFCIFLVGALAESNRSPFDLPEADSEIIAGHLTEYSGFKYALFFMAEYMGMMAISGMAVTLFLGGWSAPLPWLGFIPSYIWFFIKLMAILFFFIWMRATTPRLRADQLMNLAWKFLLPLALVNIFVTMFWLAASHTSWQWIGWAMATALLFGAYVALGTIAMEQKNIRPREYRYAD